jgi:hypothetical protein
MAERLRFDDQPDVRRRHVDGYGVGDHRRRTFVRFGFWLCETLPRVARRKIDSNELPLAYE